MIVLAMIALVAFGGASATTDPWAEFMFAVILVLALVPQGIAVYRENPDPEPFE